MAYKIHQRLTLIFGVIFAIVFLGIYAYLHRTLTEDAYRQIRESLERELLLSKIYVEKADRLSEDWDTVADLMGEASGLRTTIVGVDGTILGDSDL
ncbi:MAG TPA: hypothetical protein PKV41_03035, partial [Candidatus Omnitrophota bacterium]|nr:hypothetical protein [Candidatus Omnitrophota bacterium]